MFINVSCNLGEYESIQLGKVYDYELYDTDLLRLITPTNATACDVLLKQFAIKLPIIDPPSYYLNDSLIDYWFK